MLSGKATFAGVIKLDDDSTLLSLVDRAMTHGRDISGLEPSTYLRVLDLLLIHGYPLATFMPLGVGPPDRRRRRALALPADDGRDGGDARAGAVRARPRD